MSVKACKQNNHKYLGMVYASKYQMPQACLIAWKHGQTKWFEYGLARNLFW